MLLIVRQVEDVDGASRIDRRVRYTGSAAASAAVFALLVFAVAAAPAVACVPPGPATAPSGQTQHLFCAASLQRLAAPEVARAFSGGGAGMADSLLLSWLVPAAPTKAGLQETLRPLIPGATKPIFLTTRRFLI